MDADNVFPYDLVLDEFNNNKLEESEVLNRKDLIYKIKSIRKSISQFYFR